MPQERPPQKLLEQMREILRTQHYSIRTEDSYVNWAKRFILFHKKRHPKEIGTAEVEVFITHLAIERNVAVSTQNQALCALIYLYQEVLKQPLESVKPVRARESEHLPTVLTKKEVVSVINVMSGISQLMAKLLYGSGLRLMECVRLRVKDLDFEQHCIVVRDGKGKKDQVTIHKI